MKKLTLLVALLTVYTGMTSIAWGQSEKVKQVIIINGGKAEFSGPPYNDRATAGTYDPAAGTYRIFDTIHVESVQDCIVDSGFAYVAAEDTLVKYNLEDLSRVTSQYVPGSDGLAVYKSFLLVSRGFGAKGDFFRIYKKKDLSLVDTFGNVDGITGDIAVGGDTAFISVTGSFGNDTGKIAMVDLKNRAFIRDIDLDTLGAGTNDLFVKNRYLYSVNLISYFSNYGTITRYDRFTDTFQTFVYDVHVTEGITLQGSSLYVVQNKEIGAVNINTMEISDTTLIEKLPAAAAYDRVNRRFYLTDTDYSSYGKTFYYNKSGQLIDSFDVGISPDAMAIQYQTSTGIPVNGAKAVAELEIYPNPVKDKAVVNLPGRNGSFRSFELLDLNGEVLLSQKAAQEQNKHSFTVNISALPGGVYWVRVKGDDKVWTGKLIKM